MLARMRGSAPFMAMVPGGVWDFGAVPTDNPFPYISVDMGHELPDNAFGTRGYAARPIVNMYSRYQGMTECYTIYNALNGLFDQAPLTLATQKFVYLLLDDAFPFNAQGLDSIKRLAVRYKTLTQEQ